MAPLDLIPIDATSVTQLLVLSGSQVSLEAPDGYVDASDPGIQVNLTSDGAGFEIRQRDAIVGSRIPDNQPAEGPLAVSACRIDQEPGHLYVNGTPHVETFSE